jgi:CheY-like chemotaxis protein
MTTTRALLLVEDNEDDVFLMKRALKGANVINPLFVAEDGQEALDYLAGAGKFADRDSYPLPAVVFLVFSRPYISGVACRQQSFSFCSNERAERIHHAFLGGRVYPSS